MRSSQRSCTYIDSLARIGTSIPMPADERASEQASRRRPYHRRARIVRPSLRTTRLEVVRALVLARLSLRSLSLSVFAFG
eukprot:6188187-Pleurochrysis_carterae.AAC.1